LMKATKDNDKLAADVAMGKLKINNLYEDAFYGMAQYQYALHWGNQADQLAGLERAVAQERNAYYLPKDTFAAALQALLELQVNSRDFGSAMHTWQSLQTVHVDQMALAKIKPIMERIEVLRKDHREYSVYGRIDEGSWNFLLFKKNFQIKVTEGRVVQIKLRCDKKYVFFAFDATLRYQVADQFGDCSVELIGDPKTSFELIQS